jgi:hypothetical protein
MCKVMRREGNVKIDRTEQRSCGDGKEWMEDKHQTNAMMHQRWETLGVYIVMLS